MVGPISDDERSSFNRRLTIGVTLLVGASGGLVALQVDPTPLQLAGAVALGLAVGYPLARFALPTGPAPATRRRRRRERRIDENPFTDGGDGADGDGDGAGENGDGTGRSGGDRSRRRSD